MIYILINVCKYICIYEHMYIFKIKNKMEKRLQKSLSRQNHLHPISKSKSRLQPQVALKNGKKTD